MTPDAVGRFLLCSLAVSLFGQWWPSPLLAQNCSTLSACETRITSVEDAVGVVGGKVPLVFRGEILPPDAPHICGCDSLAFVRPFTSFPPGGVRKLSPWGRAPCDVGEGWFERRPRKLVGDFSLLACHAWHTVEDELSTTADGFVGFIVRDPVFLGEQWFGPFRWEPSVWLSPDLEPGTYIIYVPMQSYYSPWVRRCWDDSPPQARLRVLPCVADCNRDGQVSVDELTLAVRVALAVAPLQDCAAADRDQDGSVGVHEVVRGVRNALSDCISTALEDESQTARAAPADSSTPHASAPRSLEAAESTSSATSPPVPCVYGRVRPRPQDPTPLPLTVSPLRGRAGEAVELAVLLRPEGIEEASAGRDFYFWLPLPRQLRNPAPQCAPHCQVAEEELLDAFRFRLEPPGCLWGLDCYALLVEGRFLRMPQGQELARCQLCLHPEAAPGAFPLGCWSGNLTGCLCNTSFRGNSPACTNGIAEVLP